jgi:hypothetical protein
MKEKEVEEEEEEDCTSYTHPPIGGAFTYALTS